MCTNGPHTFMQPCDSMHANTKGTLSSIGPCTAHSGLIPSKKGVTCAHTNTAYILHTIYFALCMGKLF